MAHTWGRQSFTILWLADGQEPKRIPSREEGPPVPCFPTEPFLSPEDSMIRGTFRLPRSFIRNPEPGAPPVRIPLPAGPPSLSLSGMGRSWSPEGITAVTLERSNSMIRTRTCGQRSLPILSIVGAPLPYSSRMAMSWSSTVMGKTTSMRPRPIHRLTTHGIVLPRIPFPAKKPLRFFSPGRLFWWKGD